MTRRQFAVSSLASATVLRAQPRSVRGRLTQTESKPSSLTLSDGKSVALEGDGQTTGVLGDPRLAGADFEVLGSFLPSGVFRIDPIHKRAVFVHKDGKRLYVTYWCAVCAIRTYTPGQCWCCQDDTALDLREKLDVD